jgi:hypothetical protein
MNRSTMATHRWLFTRPNGIGQLLLCQWRTVGATQRGPIGTICHSARVGGRQVHKRFTRGGAIGVYGSISLPSSAPMQTMNRSWLGQVRPWGKSISRWPPEKGGKTKLWDVAERGLTPKIHSLADVLGRILRLLLTAGQNS